MELKQIRCFVVSKCETVKTEIRDNSSSSSFLGCIPLDKVFIPVLSSLLQELLLLNLFSFATCSFVCIPLQTFVVCVYIGLLLQSFFVVFDHGGQRIDIPVDVTHIEFIKTEDLRQLADYLSERTNKSLDSTKLRITRHVEIGLENIPFWRVDKFISLIKYTVR